MKNNIQTFVYKCPFVSCEAFYNTLRFLQNHLQTVNHSFYSEKVLKCVFYKCSSVLTKDEIRTHGVSKHNIKIRSSFYEDYKNALLDLSECEIFNLEKIKNKYTINNNINIDQCKELCKILKAMIEKGYLYIYKDGFFTCKIWGCNKKYKLISAYKGHILTHKHSLSKMLDFSSQFFNVDRIEIYNFLSSYNSVFNLDNLIDFLYFTKDWTHSVIFENDLQKFVSENIQLDGFKETYDNISEENNQKFINKIFYRNTIYDVVSENFSKNHTFYNLKECIMSSWKDDKSQIFVVGTSPNYKHVSINSFETLNSRIYIFKNNFFISDTIEVSCGYARKICGSFVNGIFEFVILFSDGIIRKLIYKDKQYELRSLYICNCIDMLNFTNNILFATDGYLIYKLDNNGVIAKSDYFDSFINSMCLRTNRIELEKCLQLEIDSLSEIREKNQKNTIICNTINGEIYSLDINLENRLTVLKNFNSHTLLYLESYDGVLYTNQLHQTSRILYIGDTYNKTTRLCDKLVFTAADSGKNIFYGGFDGTLDVVNFRLKVQKRLNLFKFVKRCDHLFLLDSEKEKEYVKEENFECCIISILVFDEYMIVLLRCGVIIKMSINHLKK